MNIRIAILAAAVIAVVGPAAAASVAKLPPSAVPVPVAELTNAYAGKTIYWPDSKSTMYWGTDGKVIGTDKPLHAIISGTWTAVDGKVCYDAAWQDITPGDKPYPLKNCWAYMRDGTKLYHQFTSDKGKSDMSWTTGKSDIDLLKAGNSVQANYDKVLAEVPKS